MTNATPWSELVAAIPEGWELRESAQLEEVSRARQRDLEASQATTARWRDRAGKAEAEKSQIREALWTIMTQLDSQAEYLGTGDDGTEWINYARSKIQKAYVECGLHLELDAARAALEGEQ